MSREDDAERWQQQDRRTDERARQFQAQVQKDLDKFKPDNLNHDLAELVDFMDKLSNRLGADRLETHQQVGVADHHEAVVQADHGLSVDVSLPIQFALGYILMEVTEAVKSAYELTEPMGKTTAEIGASFSEMLDQFKAATARVVDEAQRQITELVAPEKTQDQRSDAPDRREPEAKRPDQSEAEPKREDQGKPDAPGKEMAELQAKQDRERAELETKAEKQREKFANSPENLKAVNEVAQALQQEMEARHTAEVQKMQEARQQQQLQMQQQSAPTR